MPRSFSSLIPPTSPNTYGTTERADAGADRRIQEDIPLLTASPPESPGLPARRRIAGADAKAILLVNNYLRQKNQAQARATLSAELLNLEMPESDHKDLIKIVEFFNAEIEAASKTSEFFCKQTLMASIISGLLIFGTAMTASALKDPAAKVSVYSSVFSVATILASDFIVAYRRSKPFSIERGIIADVAATYISLGIIAAINEMPDQLGLREDDPHRSTMIALYAYINSIVTDAVRNQMQRLMHGLPTVYTGNVNPSEIGSAHFAVGLDYLLYLMFAVSLTATESRPANDASAPNDLLASDSSIVSAHTARERNNGSASGSDIDLEAQRSPRSSKGGEENFEFDSSDASSDHALAESQMLDTLREAVTQQHPECQLVWRGEPSSDRQPMDDGSGL